MTDRFSAPLKRGALERILDTPAVTTATRDALRARFGEDAPAPSALSKEAFATLTAVCDRLVPQDDPDRRVDLAARLDRSLAEGGGDGWRFDDLPPDREAVERGMAGIEQSARAMFSQPFAGLPPDRRDKVLAVVQDGSADGEIWRTLPPSRLFEELLGQIATLYYAHPYAQESIGYIGMADADGFQALGLNSRDAIEEAASFAPL